MATVSHNAMRRYPINGSTDGNQSSQHYYVASSQQLSPKKTWTQRLRISKSEKSSAKSPIADISSELSGSSTLSRSMKYAEPWLYGTVRGIPARQVHHNGQAIFTPIPSEVAVVVCSCPEYLTGTKREIKKASICKKCKGSRLPLAPIGGTVRITSTTAVPLLHKSRSSAGTMRLSMTTSGSVKSRPSILDPQNDPYDLMRRTRLLSPETKSLSKSSDKSIRNRAKSTSPTRGRSRSRLKPAPPPPTSHAQPTSSLHVMDEVLPSVKNNRNKNIATNKQQDCWFDTLEPDHGGRRSILHCNVNPYDLISSNTSTHHMNEFSPNNDDDDIFGTSHHYRITGTISKSLGKTLNYSNVKAIAGQRISFGDEKTTKSTSSLITQICENFKYENSASCSKKGISESNGMENSKLKHSKPQQQQQIQQQSQHRHTQLHGVVNEKVIKKDGGNQTDVKQQPKRPPRRKHDTNGTVVDEDNEVLLSTVTSTKMTNECNGTIIEGHSVPSPSSISLSLKPSSSSAPTLKPQISSDSSLVTSQRQGGIKSILKRPSSLTSPLSSSLSSSVSTSSATTTVGNLEKNNTKNYLSDTIARNDAHTNSSKSDKTSSISTNVKGDTTKCNDKTSTSQFYLPLPQPTRKKVQFMVEDKIILDESDENKILEENENNMTKILTKTPAALTSKIIMGHNGQDRISSIKQQQKQQDKQQEILELLQKEKKTDIEVIVGSNSNRIKDDYIRGMNKNNENCYISENNNSFNLNETQTESSSKLMVNGKPTKLSLSSLSNGKMKSYKSTSFNDENCILIIKKEEDTNDEKEHQQLFFKRKELQYNEEEEEREEHQNDEDDESKVQSSSSSSISRKQQSPLRRTLSDRRSNTTTIILNFNDTMALRAKNNTRMDSRELFIEDDQQQQQQSKQQLLYYSDEEVHKNENKINQNDTKKDIDLNCKDLKEHQKEKQQQLQKYHTQQSVLKPKNEFLPEIMSKTTIAQIKVINDEIALENRLKESPSFSSYTSSILRKQNELHTISAQQQQIVEKPQNSKSFKQQHHQEQQSSGKRISWQEDIAIMIKNDSNISSSWDKENTVNKNVENICENSNNMQQRNDLNHITEQNNNESISVISDNAYNNKSISNSNNDSNNSKIKLKDQENLNYQFKDFKNLTEHKDMEIGRNNEDKMKIHEIEKEKLLQAQNEIYNGARLFGNSQQQQQQQYHHQNSTIYSKLSSNNSSPSSPSVPQKTVVRVAPFNKTSSEIHRLKIQHHDVDNHADDNIISQKKTSILINGDDCYSTVNVSNDTPIYQSSVVVTDGPKNTIPSTTSPLSSLSSSTSISSFTPSSSISLTGAENLGITTTNTVTISVSNNIKHRTPEEDIIYKNNKINTLLSQNVTKSVIPIVKDEKNISENVMMTTTTATTTMTTNLRNDNSNSSNLANRVRTLITLDYGDDGAGDALGGSSGRSGGVLEKNKNESKNDGNVKEYNDNRNISNNVFSHEEELVKILRNPVEAVKRNLVPHVCGKSENTERGNVKNQSITSRTSNSENSGGVGGDTITNTSLKQDKSSFIGKLLQDSTLSQLAEGLDGDVVAKLIENSLKRLKDSRNNVDTSGTKDNDDMTKLIDTCLQKIKEERHKLVDTSPGGHNIINNKKSDEAIAEEQESQSNRGSISSGNSYSSANYELFDFENNESDCYQSCSSEITADDDTNPTRNKFYQMLVDATLSEIEITTNNDDDHHYESIRINNDPIYEEISEIPPPLPLSPPPINDPDFDKKNARSMFEGASKYDILSYLVDAKERGLVREESYEYNFSNTSDIIVEEEMSDTLSDLNKRQQTDTNSRMSHLSITSDSSEDTSLTNSFNDKLQLTNTTGTTLITQQQQQQKQQQQQNQQRKTTSDIERNDSGVGSETSKSSRSKYQSQSLSLSSSSSSQLSGINGNCSILDKNSPIHLCEDCDGPVETQITDSGVMYAPLVCRKCGKKRAERKEIITEIVETEEKYGRDLQIILEEFCQPMFVAGLLTQEQLSAIFLNTEELLENNQALAERMRDALDIALEQGDDDLLTVNVGKIFLECTQMLHTFESYCIRQAGASLLLANLEKEKELLRIFLRVSQMENTVLRRMNLNSFLMVPVQRVTKYPLLLARLYKVTPQHLEGRELLKQAQEKIELHLNHMNQEAKDVPTKLWRRISSSSPNRRASCEIDMINIKLRKMSIDVLEWNHDEVRFAMEGKLLFTQPTDSNWKKGRTIKLTPVNALLVTNGKPSTNYKAEKALSDQLNFPKHTGIREAALLLVKEKCGRYTLIREPLYLDRCVICTETDWDDYFEVHEISSKDTFIFKAEDGVRSKQWYTQLQYHAQGMGTWRKRRNALANIMINGMLSRT